MSPQLPFPAFMWFREVTALPLGSNSLTVKTKVGVNVLDPGLQLRFLPLLKSARSAHCAIFTMYSVLEKLPRELDGAQSTIQTLTTEGAKNLHF